MLRWHCESAEQPRQLRHGLRKGFCYLYDACGNVLQSKTEDSIGSLSKHIQTQVEYNTADAALGVSEGVYARVQRDARGKEVTTETDLLRGTVTSTTDPKGQTVSNTYAF